MALTKIINDLADLNQSGSTNALKGCAGTTAQQPVSSSSIEYLIVGGGGAGGWSGGGGGAGGLLTGTTTVYHGIPTVLTIGEGGTGIVATTSVYYLGNGNDSGFNGIRAIGGGTGGSYSGGGTPSDGFDGGSGGGAASNGISQTGGSGTTGQGLSGGNNYTATAGWGGGGGGGAGTSVGNADGTGSNGTASTGGNGGSGRDMQSFIGYANANLAQIGDVSGSNVWFAGGGGGGIQDQSPVSVTGGTGGNGGGANGSGNADTPTAAQSNTGGGGGGGGQIKNPGWIEGSGGDGGSGVAILKYDNTVVTGYSLNSEDTYTVNWPADKYGVAYYPLNLDVKDVGGHYDGTATDITYVTGKFNQAASFNGSSSWIDTNTTFSPTLMSFSAWVYPTSISHGSWYSRDIISNRNGNTGNYNGIDFGIVTGTGNLYTRFSDGSNQGSTSSNTVALAVDAWNHVAFTVDTSAGEAKVYKDGSLEYTVSIGTGSGIANGNNFYIGRYFNASEAYWNGQIEQIRIYGSVLTASNITDIYNNSKPGSLPPLSSTAPTIDSLSFPSGVTTKALWDFNGDLIADPTTYNGSITSSISYATGKFTDQALYFNGLGGGLISTNYTRSGSNFTASLWVNLLDRNGQTSPRQVFLGDGDSGGADTSISITMQITHPGDVLKVYMNSADGATTGNSVTTSVDWNNYWGKWTHVAVTQNGGDVKIYVNGILVDTLTVTGSQILSGSAAQAIALGSWGPAANNNGETWGSINLMRFYDVTLSDQNIYDLWQKETNIQTYFTSGSTDTLVFKEGSGEITFKNDAPPGAEIGMLRYNSTLNKMEHFTSGGWKNFSYCTTDLCNYPTQANSVLLYRFNDDVTDTCGTYNGTAGGSLSYTIGKFGKAINTTSGYVDTGYIFPADSTMSVSFWMKMTANPGSDVYMLSDMDSGTSNRRLDIRIAGAYGNKLYIDNGNGSSNDQEDTGWVPTQNVWYHIVVTFNGTAGILYVNGVSTYSYTSTVALGTAGGQTQVIGRAGHHPCCNFPGLIDQFRLFTSTLTADEVLDLYNEVQC